MFSRPALRVAVAAGLALSLAGGPAFADKGVVKDGKTGGPDIRKLEFDNRKSEVWAKLTMSDLAKVDRHSIFFRWGSSGEAYEAVFHTSKERYGLYYLKKSKATPKYIACRGQHLNSNGDAQTFTVTFPRKCLKEAPNTLRFDALASKGSKKDTTKLSKAIKRG